MIVKEKLLDVETNITNSKAFSIKNSAKAFKILSSGLYSNKPRAIVREIFANAYDSHISAGCPDKPFEVKVPNVLDETFYVRDFGTGLTREEIESIYTTYFESTKTNSNDTVGCLGLGSKSPFCYTDSFIVTSWKDGKRITCICALNPQGFPSVLFADESDSEEPNGLKVALQINRSDFYSFANECRDIAKWFKVKPTFIGADIQFSTEEVFYEDEHCKIVKNGGGNSYVLMGNIIYPNDNYNLKTIHSVQPYYYFDIILKAKIGEVEVTASRESLEYTEETKNFIQKAKSTLANSMNKYFMDIIEKCDNFYDACITYKTYKNFITSKTWNGQTFKEYMKVGDFSPTDTQAIYICKHYGSRSSSLVSDDSNYTLHIYDSEIYVNDCKYASRRIKNTKLGRQAILFNGYKVDELCKIIGCKPEVIKLTSELPEPPKTTYTKSSVKARLLTNYKYGLCKKVEVDDIEDIEYYLAADSGNINSKYIALLMKLCAEKNINVVIIPKSLIKKIDTSSMKHADTLAQEYITKYKDIVKNYCPKQEYLKPLINRKDLINQEIIKEIEAYNNYINNKQECDIVAYAASTKSDKWLDKCGMLGYVMRMEYGNWTRVVKVDDAVQYLNSLS